MTSVGTSTKREFAVHYKTDPHQRSRYLLPRRRATGRSRDPAASRLPDFVQHVSQLDSATREFISRDCAGLSRIWSEQHARSQELRVHVRKFRGHRGQVGRAAGRQQVLDVRDGLRGSRRLPAGVAPSRTRAGAHCAERKCLRRRAARSSGTRSRPTGTRTFPRSALRFISWSSRKRRAGSTRTASAT